MSEAALASGEDRRALAVGLLCFLLWGAMPLLFIAAGRGGASPWEILGQRTLWAAPWAGLLVLIAGQGREVIQVFARPRLLAALALSAALIVTGWAVYVWAVNNGRNIESSLGYYITPLLNMAAGAIFFRERIDRIGAAAIALAVIGVALQTWALGHLPVIALVLALTFWGYGLIRRRVTADALTGLCVECLLLMAPGAAYLIWLHGAGGGVFGKSPGVTMLLLATGPATVAPLALFAWTARRVPFQTLGFLQFISPTIGFAVGVALGESLTPLRIASFIFIWAGAATYIYGAWRAARRLAPP
jgi:chloramphenicol-sensitive protein RarD